MQDSKILLKVTGMDCANCAQTITRTLTKDGLKDVNVDFLTGEVTFRESDTPSVSDAVTSIQKLGYSVNSRSDQSDEIEHDHSSHAESSQWKFVLSAVSTLPLLLHMIFHFPWLHNPVVQLILCTPVMIIGFLHFGKSAYHSLKAGFPNMDVLIFIGSTAAYVYSVFGLFIYSQNDTSENYIFFETAATIITLVLLGGLIEQRSVKRTTDSITHLGNLQPGTARKIIVNGNNELIVEVSSSEIKAGDYVAVNSGDRIPADGTIVKGNVRVNESMLTGETLPLEKGKDDILTGGTIIEQGQATLLVKNSGNETTLSRIIEIVKQAQHSKPKIQKLGDRISAIFVPVVLSISIITFFVSVFVAHLSVTDSMMHSIAVLVISCPCAMGLATPTAVMVGLGRAARNGILVKGGSTIEQLARVKTIVFDKTGTITTGKFKIKNITAIDFQEEELKKILFELEQHSSHPIAKAVTKELSNHNKTTLTWKDIKEDKGVGINATDSNNNLFSAGSFKMVEHFYHDLTHDLYILKNNKLIGYIDIEDEIKPGVKEVMTKLISAGYKTILLSGDRKEKVESAAMKAGISEYYFEKLPAEKLDILARLSKENPVAMVGDGINDAPSLSTADVGISMSDSTDVAIQSAQIILLANKEFDILLKALRIGELTFQTIRQNLFWAFFYNVVAIPAAAFGFLSPAVAAFSMAFSDVIVIGNSLRLRTRKI